LKKFQEDEEEQNIVLLLFPSRKGGKKRGKKLFSSNSTNVCDVTHPSDTRTNPSPPRSDEIHLRT
jgi:hypothetical protein